MSTTTPVREPLCPLLSRVACFHNKALCISRISLCSTGNPSSKYLLCAKTKSRKLCQLFGRKSRPEFGILFSTCLLHILGSRNAPRTTTNASSLCSPVGHLSTTVCSLRTKPAIWRSRMGLLQPRPYCLRSLTVLDCSNSRALNK